MAISHTGSSDLTDNSQEEVLVEVRTASPVAHTGGLKVDMCDAMMVI